MPVVTTSAKGQVVIPAEYRRKIGLRPGGKALVWLEGDRKVGIEAVPDDPVAAACGMFHDPGFSYTEALLKERREDLAREEKKFARLFRRNRVSKQRPRLPRGR